MKLMAIHGACALGLACALTACSKTHDREAHSPPTRTAEQRRADERRADERRAEERKEERNAEEKRAERRAEERRAEERRAEERLASERRVEDRRIDDRRAEERREDRRDDRQARTVSDPTIRATAASAVTTLAAERCDREMRCKNIGAKEKYKTRAECIAEMEKDKRDDLNSDVCRGGIRQKELNECLDAIHDESCGNPLDTLTRLNACRTGNLCAK
jgi:hypothetical protein